jgi:hypothetical protein
MHYRTWFIGWNGVLLTFWLGWSWTSIFPSSTSQVAWITGMSHCSRPHPSFSWVITGGDVMSPV